MARVNIYLPDDLAAAARQNGMNMSAVAQDAVRRQLAARSTDIWLATLGAAPSADVSHERALAALDAAREEPPTHHG